MSDQAKKTPAFRVSRSRRAAITTAPTGGKSASPGRPATAATTCGWKPCLPTGARRCSCGSMKRPAIASRTTGPAASSLRSVTWRAPRKGARLFSDSYGRTSPCTSAFGLHAGDSALAEFALPLNNVFGPRSCSAEAGRHGHLRVALAEPTRLGRPPLAVNPGPPRRRVGVCGDSSGRGGTNCGR